MSEEEVPAGPPAWPGGAGSNDPWGGARWTSAPPPPPPGWWPQTFYTYEPPPPPRRTSRLLMLGVAVVIFVFAASAAATAVIATRGFGGSGSTAGVQAAVVDIDTSLGDGAAAAGTGIVLTSAGVVLTNYHVVQGEQTISVRLTSTGADLPGDRDRRRHVPRRRRPADSRVQAASRQHRSATPRACTSATASPPSATRKAAAARRRWPQVQVTALEQTITASDETGNSTETLNGMIQTNAPIQPGDFGRSARQQQRPGDRHGHRSERRTQGTGAGRRRVLRDPHQHRAQLRTPAAGAAVGTARRPRSSGCAPQDDTAPSGVLVAVGCGTATGVVSGSPAADGGLTAGDVITEIGGDCGHLGGIARAPAPGRPSRGSR